MDVLDLVLDMGIALTTERDLNKLLDFVLLKSMDISQADVGIIYLCKQEEQELELKILRNHIVNINEGIHGEPSDFPPISQKAPSFCASAITRNQPIKIDNLREMEDLYVTCLQSYGKIPEQVQSMLVLPLSNREDKVVAVMQLFNARNERKELAAFRDEDIKVFQTMASQIAILIINIEYIYDIRQMTHAFIQVLMTMFEKQTAYNALHTKNMVFYMEAFVDYVNEQYRLGKTRRYFSRQKKDEILLSTWLHDIGKIITPLEILNKSTRLADKLETVLNRLEYIRAVNQLAKVEKRISILEWTEIEQQLNMASEHIQMVNAKPLVTNEDIEQTKSIAKRTYVDLNGNIHGWLEPKELEALMIERGTLTKGEREIIEEHVVHTEMILKQMKLPSYFRDGINWASQHHECLNGKGYPRGLTAEQLSFESRVLAIIDIFEALSAKDRPYKNVLNKEQVFQILFERANAGDLDLEIVQMLKDMIEERNLFPS